MNTSSMLPSERMLFESLSIIMSEFRKNVLFKLASGELPEISILSESISKLDINMETVLSQGQQEPTPDLAGNTPEEISESNQEITLEASEQAETKSEDKGD